MLDRQRPSVELERRVVRVAKNLYGAMRDSCVLSVVSGYIENYLEPIWTNRSRAAYICAVAYRQGLYPRDFDNADGRDAFGAIAIAYQTTLSTPDGDWWPVARGLSLPNNWRQIVQTTCGLLLIAAAE